SFSAGRRGAALVRDPGARAPPGALSRGAGPPPPRPGPVRRRPPRTAAVRSGDRALPPLRRRGRLAGGPLGRGARPPRPRRSPLGRQTHPAVAAPRPAVLRTPAAPGRRHLPGQ